MADLEDTIFKQNIPGRWSTHEPKGLDIRHDDVDIDEINEPTEDENKRPMTEEESLFEYARNLSQNDVPEPIRRSILAERMRKNKTGVKGVLADYKAAVELDKAHRQAVSDHRQAVITRMAEGYIMSPEESMLLQSQKMVTTEELDDLDFEDDSEFMEEFRKKRLQEMLTSSSAPLFTGCLDVDTSNFLEEVEKEDSRVVVIVHLYEPSIPTCVRMNRFLEEISTSMRDIKFLRMSASANLIEVDRLTLPILNIYKGGEIFTVLAGIADELGGDYFSKEEVEWLIESTLQPTA